MPRKLNLPNVPVPPPMPDELAQLKLLTPRQNQVARMVANGMSYRAIAEELGIMEVGVTSAMKHAYRKIDAHRREDVVRLVIWDTALRYLSDRLPR